MAKKAVSVTLDTANVLWLKGRAKLAGGNVSDALDKLVTSARLGRSGHLSGPTSVVGMVDLGGDPDLLKADATVQAWFAEYLAKPKFEFEVDEDPPAKSRQLKARKSRG